MKIRTHRQSGLSLFEVALVVATVVLLALVFWPMLTRSKRSSRIGCTGNLKQVGLSYRLFSNDHQDKFPFAVSKGDGGTLEFVKTSQVFRHFEAMSNELVTPKVLVCPVDFAKGGRQRATDFLTGLANSNVSYFVGLDGDESKNNRILSGDRNITGGTLLRNGFLRVLSSDAPAGWTEAIHKDGNAISGNIGLSDGSAQQVMPAELQKRLQAQDLRVIRLAIP